MKILHIDFDDLKSPYGGGQAVRTFEINRRLAQHHQITVVTGNYPGSKNEIIENIQYLRIGKEKFPWNFITFLISIPRVIKKIDHDVVVENFTPPIGPALTPLFTSKPVVAMVDWGFAWEMSKKYKLPFFLWQNIGLKFYKNFIFPTKAMQKYLLKGKTNRKNILILPNVPSCNFTAESVSQLNPQLINQSYLLFLGRLDIHQKGLDLLLLAFQKAFKQIQAPLLIAGEGKDKEKVRKYIKKLGLQKKVILLGKVKNRKKVNLLKKARVVCLPSRYEACSFAATESLVLKKPVVAFGLPFAKETLQNQAIFAKPFDINDLANKMIYAFKNAGRISQKIKLKPLPSWNEIAEEQEKFYQKITRKQ